MEFAGDRNVEDVPDPYYGGPLGFEQVLDLAEEAAAGLLDEVLKSYEARRRR
jgi:protein-tyrosine phosphatase